MNIKRHFQFISLIFGIAILLSSCSFGGMNVFESSLNSDKEISNSTFEKIISSIQSQNKNKLKKLFSQNAIEDSDDFDQCMMDLFDFFEGKMISYNDWGGPNTNYGKNDDGSKRNWKNMQSTYDVETDKGTYRFGIKAFYKDTSDPDNVGVYSLYIIRAQDSDMQFAYWGDGKWTPGINIVK